MNTITAKEASTYRKIIDDAIEKLRQTLYKNHRSPQLFWKDYNNYINNNVDDDDHDDDNHDDDDDESTEIEESSDDETKTNREMLRKFHQENNFDDDDDDTIEQHLDAIRDLRDEINGKKIQT
jgi:hypothetical protein